MAFFKKILGTAKRVAKPIGNKQAVAKKKAPAPTPAPARSPVPVYNYRTPTVTPRPPVQRIAKPVFSQASIQTTLQNRVLGTPSSVAPIKRTKII